MLLNYNCWMKRPRLTLMKKQRARKVEVVKLNLLEINLLKALCLPLIHCWQVCQVYQVNSRLSSEVQCKALSVHPLGQCLEAKVEWVEDTLILMPIRWTPSLRNNASFIISLSDTSVIHARSSSAMIAQLWVLTTLSFIVSLQWKKPLGTDLT